MEHSNALYEALAGFKRRGLQRQLEATIPAIDGLIWRGFVPNDAVVDGEALFRPMNLLDAEPDTSLRDDAADALLAEWLVGCWRRFGPEERLYLLDVSLLPEWAVIDASLDGRWLPQLLEGLQDFILLSSDQERVLGVVEDIGDRWDAFIHSGGSGRVDVAPCAGRGGNPLAYTGICSTPSP